ncbi:hypothetical protein LTR81_027931, partial [Elasticomyces elasticus]
PRQSGRRTKLNQSFSPILKHCTRIISTPAASEISAKAAEETAQFGDYVQSIVWPTKLGDPETLNIIINQFMRSAFKATTIISALKRLPTSMSKHAVDLSYDV